MDFKTKLNELGQEIVKAARSGAPSSDYNISAYDGKEKLERVTLVWDWAEKLEDMKGVLRSKPFQFPLPYNPTSFKVSRAPFIAVRKSTYDFLTGGSEGAGTGNTKYKEGSSVLAMAFMLDDTESLEKETLATLLTGRKTENRVLAQMQILATMAEPVPADTLEFKVPDKPSKPWEQTANAEGLKKLVPDKGILNPYSKHADYKYTTRQPPGITVIWGDFVFVGTVRSLAFAVAAADSDGNPRRVNVSVSLKGDAFTQVKREYSTTPGTVSEKGETVPLSRAKEELQIPTANRTLMEEMQSHPLFVKARERQ